MSGKSLPCPHCRQLIAVEAGSCPHCNRRALFDLTTMFESPDDRSAYHAARSLTEVRGQPHEFLDLKQRLMAAPGVVVTSVPRSIAFACQEKLADILSCHRRAVVGIGAVGSAFEFHDQAR